jgi:hypothetical protein
MGRRASPTTTPAKTRPIAVQLPIHMVKQLDELAAQSGLTRHKYMIRVLTEAVIKNVVVRESVNFSNDPGPEVTDKTP